MADRLPLSARTDPEKAAAYEALAEGVPPWMQPSLNKWLRDLGPRGSQGNLVGWDQFILEIERHVRAGVSFQNSNATPEWNLLSAVKNDDELFLDVVDFCAKRATSQERDGLRTILKESGSAFAVRGDHLERRVSEETRAAVDAVISSGDRAADHMGAAWALAFGRDPDSTGAYREAVRAVEAALASIVSPNSDRATLGTIIKDIEAKPSKFWLHLEPDDMDGVGAFVSQLRLLWKGQHDRHGTADTDAPLNVTIEQAQDAVILAVQIVQWVQSGAFRRA